MVPNAMATRVPAGSHPATTWPEDFPSGRIFTTRPWSPLVVEADRVSRHDHELVGQKVGDALYDVFEHAEAQRENDGVGALQNVAVVGGDYGSAFDLCRQSSGRFGVDARQS